MDRLNGNILLVIGALCMGFLSDAMAVPSVRILGANSNTTGGATAKPIAANKGDSMTTTRLMPSSAKSATNMSGSASGANVRPVSTNRIGSTKTIANTTNRFPTMQTKANYQVSTKPYTGTVSTVTTPTVNPVVPSDIQAQLDAKVDRIDLNNYYTKPEIDAFRTEYYTADQVDGIISSLDLGNAEQVLELTNTVADHTEKINNLIQNGETLYDYVTGEHRYVTITDTFSSTIFDND